MHEPHSAPASPSAYRSATVRPLDRLSVRQAIVTLIIAVLLGILAGGLDLMSDYRTQHAEIRARIAANVKLVHGTAVEAAYQLSNDLAGEVVQGLADDPAVVEAAVIDNFGGVLGRTTRVAAGTPFPRLANALFGDVAYREVPLESVGPNGKRSTVGTLILKLDPGEFFNRFLGRVVATMLSRATRAIILCVMIVGVFYLLITKPLLQITAAIGTVDPARPGAFPIGVPKRHERDELGLLASTITRMLASFQEGLNARDQAEGALAALAHDLEQRVEQRTAELAREKEGVERALVQLNFANGELEQANRFINDGIRYASRIQTALLPHADALAGIVEDVAAGWHPLGLVGGDYYWAGRFGRKGVVAVVDCTGHGVPGAFMTAVVASALGRVLHHQGHDDPAEILINLNRFVKSALRQDREGAVSNDGLDAGICVIDPDSRSVGFAGANLPLLVRSGRDFREVRGDRMSIGYAESPGDFHFTSHRIACAPGDCFYLFTDGVYDQVGGPNRRLLGRRRVREILAEVAKLPLEDQMRGLFQRLDAWRGSEPRRDDMTFFAFRPICGEDS